MKILSWADFDDARFHLASVCRDLSPDAPGIYGIPRGGLCLAVALSHALSLPLLSNPEPGCIIVDDIYETGTTLNPFLDQGIYRVITWLRRSSSDHPHLLSARSIDSDDWIVFPWEDAKQAARDARVYHASRQ